MARDIKLFVASETHEWFKSIYPVCHAPHRYGIAAHLRVVVPDRDARGTYAYGGVGVRVGVGLGIEGQCKDKYASGLVIPLA